MCRKLLSILSAEVMAMAALAQPVLPTCPPGWNLEVMATAPKIRHPSVVCCAPDGRVFVAEDPMDISAPSANLALGRIICFHPDGKTTLFADKLYAVFGMQYLEGKLYVLHNPKFSVFSDDQGTGKDRLDLIESTNPNPWALDWNDHVPANFRLAMDGFLYVAVGDKGIYGAIGKDGKRVDLQGGGILRLRPDGTELEVYSTGVRNILDVAINAEDEIFTYDNTDEQQWMGRLTHMVEGGFYGYPYDFTPRRPSTLWMMADYGGGAATGTLAYNEDGLPSEYHGNLFLSDFGKRQVLRVKVTRDGASFQAGSREDFFSNVPNDFRPVGIALAPDGTSIYICDWAHADTKEKVEVGRLLKLSYTGKNHSAPKPAWYLPAAAGQKFSATTAELIDALAHASHSVRMTAQRRLADKGRLGANDSGAKEVIQSLAALLGDQRAAGPARWHAIWALDAIDGGLAAREKILAAASDNDLSVRRQAIRQLGTRRVELAVQRLQNQLKAIDASVRFQAATALGRIRSTTSVAPLLDMLEDPDPFARYAVFTALNQIGRNNPSTWETIAAGLASSRLFVREGTTFAMRETYDTSLVEALSKVARDSTKPSIAREAALKAAAALHHQKPAWKGEWWAYHPVNAPPPAKTVAWPGTARVLALLRESLDDPNAGVRLASVEGLREAKDVSAAPKLLAIFQSETDIALKQSLLKALGTFKDPSAKELIRSLLNDPQRNQALLSESIAAAEQIGGEELAAGLLKLLRSEPGDKQVLLQIIEALSSFRTLAGDDVIARYARHADGEIRERALATLVKLRKESVLDRVLPLLEDPSIEIRRSALAALTMLKTKSVVPQLLKAYEDVGTRSEAIAALAANPDVRAVDAYLNGLAGKNAQVRENCRRAIKALQNELLPKIELKLSALPPEIVAELQQIYRSHAEARKSRLFALTAKKLEPADYLAFVLKNPGDAKQGRELFNDLAGVACIKCHALGGQGGGVGPDLSTIGAQSSRPLLVESIIFPSKAVREGYQQYIVETKSDEVIAGLLKAETPEELVLQDSEARLHRIRKADLTKRRSSEISLMPEGLHEALSLGQFADLVAFLEGLKGNRPARANP
jgi:putative membrane-bound dehydrogenase-like protein